MSALPLLAHISVATEVGPWVAIVAGIVALAWLNKRGHTGEALDWLEKANNILHEENATLKKELQELLARIAILQARTDVTIAIHPLEESLQRHDERMQRMSEAMLRVLEQIAARLGPDPDNGTAG